MKHSAKYRIWIAAGLIACAGSAWAQGTPAATADGERVGIGQPLYVPPMRGAPERRVGGASRGAEKSDLRFSSLAPEHVGLVGEAAPTLFWYSSKVAPEAVIFTLGEENAELPLVERELPGLVKPGLQKVSLSELGIRLEPGKTYEWFITVRRGGTERSKDWVCGGGLYYQPGEAVSGEAPQAVRTLAAQGRWYEALARSEAALADATLPAAQRSQLQADRRQLLQDVGLGDLAQRLHQD